jgi:hypothetical protein
MGTTESGNSGREKIKKSKGGASKMNIFPCVRKFTQQLSQKVPVINEGDG